MDGETPLPDWIKVPVELLFAEGVEAKVLLTMLRLMALCAGSQATPFLTADELAQALQCSRSTLYRHLQILGGRLGGDSPRELRWVEVHTDGRRLSVRPTRSIAPPDPAQRPAPEAHPAEAPPATARRRALAELGILDPKRASLARSNLDPAWIEGWGRWVTDHGWHLKNPRGFVIRRLEAGQPPPACYLATDLEAAAGADWGPLEPEPAVGPDLGASTDDEMPPDELAAARSLWHDRLRTLKAVVGLEAFERHVAGAAVVEAGPDGLVIAAADEAAARWLERFVGDSLRLAWRERTGRTGDVTFAVQMVAQGRGGPSRPRGAGEPSGADPSATA